MTRFGRRSIEERAAAALMKAGLTGRDALLAVAVSGGPDSMALLHVLLRLREPLALRLHVAHIDHDFRGEEAVEDARFVKAQAEALGLPATIGKEDPVAYKEAHRISSMEEALRLVRYAFLARTAREVGADAVALGHTSDDQAETVLLHIIRGAGLHGLRGMEPDSVLSVRQEGLDVKLVRPLLDVSRAETRAFCEQNGIPFRDDTTNRSMRWTRNRVRYQLMPALRGYNPRVQDALLRLSRTASEEVAALEELAERVYQQATRSKIGLDALDVRVLRAQTELVRKLVFRRAYQRAAGSSAGLEGRHLDALARLVDAPPGKRLHLPNGVVASATYGTVRVSARAPRSVPLPPLEGEHRIAVPGESHAGLWLVRSSVLRPPSSFPDGIREAALDLDALGHNVCLRSRRPGDRFQPLGVPADKKLQDFFVDEKVPREWRDRVPLLVGERGIAWVVGYRIAHWARVTPETKRAVLVVFQETGPSLPDRPC